MEKEKLEEQEESIFNKEFWIKIVRLVVGGTLALLGYFYLNESNFNLAVNLTVMLIAWIILAYDVLIEAFEDVIKEHEIFSENFLMIIASIGAFAIRAFGPNMNEFIEAVMVMFLFQIGEMFEDIADNRSHKAIKSAVGLRATVAHKLNYNEIIDISPEELKIDDTISCRVGEILPADGIVIEGNGYLDMSSLTGEFVPVKKEVGEAVNAGTILKQGNIIVKVTKEYKDNTVSKILKLIEEGSESKGKGTRFVDKFAKIYTPIVVILALVLMILPPLIINYSDPLTWENWIYRALNLLIISCPCAIVISVPLTYFAGIGLASKNGIIIKGASIFDSLSELEELVTDKTGTLTYGDFKVTKVCTNMDKNDFLTYLRASESRSNHPIALAIEKEDGEKIVDTDITNYNEIAGHGISCTYKGKNILAGNSKLMKANNIEIPENDEIGSIVYLAIDDEYKGYVICSDTIRKESKDLVSDLHKKNIKVTMLTGDKTEIAKKTSEELNLDEYNAELLPEDKTKLLKEKIDNKKKSIAYMGDGINDAASIALADVGVAMGGQGSDLAIDNADLVIMNDNPRKFSLSLKIASLVRNHMIFNIVFSLLVKVTIMILATTIKNFPLIISVLADTGLTMVLVFISMLMLRHKFKEVDQK